MPCSDNAVESFDLLVAASCEKLQQRRWLHPPTPSVERAKAISWRAVRQWRRQQWRAPAHQGAAFEHGGRWPLPLLLLMPPLLLLLLLLLLILLLLLLRLQLLLLPLLRLLLL
eukprot:NODE_7804_length_1549_cov_4.759494.p6 GENE.NODE_7804_length_1549_cov_4.759494~~NODE_7804_length_1549_cov_4.759494.p6  ORF type:complete len:113 (-),score=29.18 NODE_7804_length_1549_cov_4.759494:136-474(-)